MSFRLEKVFALIYDHHEIESFGIEPITQDEIHSKRVGGDVRRKITTLKEFTIEKRSSLFYFIAFDFFRPPMISHFNQLSIANNRGSTITDPLWTA